MSLGATKEQQDSSPSARTAEVDWHTLDKSRFFILGAALFSGVSGALYPIVVLKTRQQVSATHLSCFHMSFSILRHEGVRGFYRGFGTSLMGTIPARALYMTALEVTKTNIGAATLRLGFSDTAAVGISNAAAGMSSAMAAQLVWTPVDVVSQRLMVQGDGNSASAAVVRNVSCRYRNGIDAFRKILCSDGLRGLYRGFGISILTYAPSNAVWWASYSLVSRLLRSGQNESSTATVAVQGLSASAASGVSAAITMPLDTVKTRLQVLDVEEKGRRRATTVVQTVRSLVKEGGVGACYRGLGPRWASMAVSATTMITTYEFVKRLSAKNQESFAFMANRK